MNTQNNNSNDCPRCEERMEEIDYLIGMESCIQVQANFYKRERDAALQQVNSLQEQVSCLQEQVNDLETRRCSMQNLAEAKHINLRLANAEKRELQYQLHLAQRKVEEQAGLGRKTRATAVRKAAKEFVNDYLPAPRPFWVSPEDWASGNYEML